MSSVEKKYIGFSDYIEKLTDDPSFFGALGTQGTGYILNTHNMLQQSLKNINEAQEKYNKLEIQYNQETDTLKKKNIKTELSQIFNQMVRLSDKIKGVQDYISNQNLFIKQEKKEKTSNFIWTSIAKKIKKKECQIKQMEELIIILNHVDESQKENIIINFQDKNPWFLKLLTSKNSSSVSSFLNVFGPKSSDNIYTIDVEQLQNLINDIKISINVIQQIKVEINPRTGFPIGENAGFLDYMLWVLNVQNKTTNLLKEIKIGPRFSIAIKSWLKSFISSDEKLGPSLPTHDELAELKEQKKELIDKFNKMADEAGKEKLSDDVDIKTFKREYHKLSMEIHPDKGGIDVDMMELNDIKQEVISLIKDIDIQDKILPASEDFQSEDWKLVIGDTIENLFGDPVDEALYNLQKAQEEGKVIVPNVGIVSNEIGEDDPDYTHEARAEEVDTEFMYGERKLFGMDANFMIKKDDGNVPFKILNDHDYVSSNPEFAKYYQKLEKSTDESVDQIEVTKDLSTENIGSILDDVVDENDLPDVTIDSEQKDKIEDLLHSVDINPNLKSYIMKGLKTAMKVLPVVVGLSTRSSRSFSIPAAVNLAVLALFSITGVNANIVSDIKPNQVIGESVENLVRDKMDEGKLLGVNKGEECTWFSSILEGLGPSFTQQINFVDDFPMSFEQDLTDIMISYKQSDSEPLRVLDLKEKSGGRTVAFGENEHVEIISFSDVNELLDTYIIGEEFLGVPFVRQWNDGTFVGVKLDLNDFDISGNLKKGFLSFTQNSVLFTIPYTKDDGNIIIPFNHIISSTDIIDFLKEKKKNDRVDTTLEKLKLSQKPSSIPRTKIITMSPDFIINEYPETGAEARHSATLRSDWRNQFSIRDSGANPRRQESFAKSLSHQLSQNLQRGKTYRIKTFRNLKRTVEQTRQEYNEAPKEIGHNSIIKVDNDGNILFFETNYAEVHTLEQWAFNAWEPQYDFLTYTIQVLDTPIEILPTTVKDLFFVPVTDEGPDPSTISTTTQDSTPVSTTTQDVIIPYDGVKLSLEEFKEVFNIDSVTSALKYILLLQRYRKIHDNLEPNTVEKEPGYNPESKRKLTGRGEDVDIVNMKEGDVISHFIHNIKQAFITRRGPLSKDPHISDEQILKLVPGISESQIEVMRQKLFKLSSNNNGDNPITGFISLLISIFTQYDEESIDKLKTRKKNLIEEEIELKLKPESDEKKEALAKITSEKKEIDEKLDMTKGDSIISKFSDWFELNAEKFTDLFYTRGIEDYPPVSEVVEALDKMDTEDIARVCGTLDIECPVGATAMRAAVIAHFTAKAEQAERNINCLRNMKINTSKYLRMRWIN